MTNQDDRVKRLGGKGKTAEAVLLSLKADKLGARKKSLRLSRSFRRVELLNIKPFFSVAIFGSIAIFCLINSKGGFFMVGTFWAFVPAIVAIALALVTRQVYLSLFAGIFVGAMFFASGNPLFALETMFTVMSEKVGENAPILVFLVVLGIFVILMQKSGGAAAYGAWAQRKIKSQRGALGATALLGCLVFVDDYFNCLTVGSVMKPVTDKFKVSHSKLAWIIDSTAAPVCIIAPISSWAAAVMGELQGNNMTVFILTIPFNVYALLTIIMVFVFCLMGVSFGKMRKDEKIANETGDLDAGEPFNESETVITPSSNAKVRNLIIPVAVLIVCCIFGMLYTGGIFTGANVVDAFANCDAGMSLAIGSTIALVIVAVYYLCARAVSFKDMMSSITEGFKTMAPAILILTFAWTLSAIMGSKGGYLDAQGFVKNTLMGVKLGAFFPAVFFLLACGIAFATGTSWGTFTVLIPIATTILGTEVNALTLITVSATLGGAVFGDHLSPISETTILSSTGAACNHVNHVKTQMPYAALIAVITFVAYLVGGASSSLGIAWCAVITFVSAVVMFAGSVLVIKLIIRKKEAVISSKQTDSLNTESASASENYEEKQSDKADESL